MPTPFSRSVRSLDNDRFHRSAWLLAAALVVLAGWVAWACLARLPLYEMSDTARLEVDRAVRPVEAVAGGRVRVTHLAVERIVQAGEVLVELEREAEQLQLAEEQARVAALSTQLGALRDQVASEQQARAETRLRAPVALDEARSRYQEAEAVAHAATEAARRLTRLHTEGLISDMEMLRATAEAQKDQAAADALRFAINRQDKDQRAKDSGQQARLDGLKGEASVLEGEMMTRAATIERLKHDLDRRVIRAPASGRLGDVASLQVGQVVREGDRLGAVIPEGGLRVVAEFLPSAALGRVRPGHTARLRLDAFSWTEFGAVTGEVESVAGEPRSGHVRVEIRVNPASAPLIPLQHGLPGKVEVEVERVSPAMLVLRAMGRLVAGNEGR